MQTDVLVVGAGLSGLTAAALLAKRGIGVTVVDRAYCPGGTCGAFKRGGALLDQGAAMLFGFGKQGFNPHRFVFNVLEEPIDILQHESMYVLEFGGRRVEFYADLDRFVEQLADMFPAEADNLRRFYADLYDMYSKVIIGTPSFTTPDETDPGQMAPAVKANPVAYVKFLSFMYRSVESLLKKYFRDPAVFQFFDKLCSTYCYTTARETPAILGAVMFIDNHVGGSFYPAGGSHFLPGRLEKVIEQNGGVMLPRREVEALEFEGGRPAAARLAGGERIEAGEIIYGGNVWDLYARLLPTGETKAKKRAWAKGLEPTDPSVVLYMRVARDTVPADLQPVEMFAGAPDRLTEDEITLYTMSVDDETLCAEDEHVMLAIGPTFVDWADRGGEIYTRRKAEVQERMLSVLEKRIPDLRAGLRYACVASPRTIERYAGKHRGAVAGPKQKMGQHMFKRQHIRTDWDNLYCCGESTTMGTGTPTVTISGIAAANAVLKKRGKQPFVWAPDIPDVVRDVQRPYTRQAKYAGMDEGRRALLQAAERCQFCEKPRCQPDVEALDVAGLMRRVSVGNLAGAARLAAGFTGEAEAMEQRCILARSERGPVAIGQVLSTLQAGAKGFAAV